MGGSLQGQEQRQEQERPDKLTVRELIRGGTAKYVNEHRDGQASPHVQSVLAKLSLCRSAALGGRWYECNDCSEITKLYNSCGDRHCPACSGSKRMDWNDRAEKLLIDGVEYYQVVFTLPKDLSTLALANRIDMAELLFQSAWKALRKSIEIEQGYEAGALMVLHTWNQKLGAHWHVHALVPAAGPSLSDGTWQQATPPSTFGSVQHERKYLVDAINLRRHFRSFAVKHLQRLRRAERLSFGGSLSHLRSDEAWDTFVDELKSTEWASHIEPPRSDSTRPSDPKHVVRYLTRYLTGGPISDYRITHADEQSVTILAREGKVTGGESKQVPYTMETAEFVRRWCLHIQPDQLTKTRQYGGWSNTRKESYLESCREALSVAGLSSAAISLSDIASPSEQADEPALPQCKHCGSDSLQLIEEFAKPSWSTVLARGSSSVPSWYAETLRQDDRQFWDGLMGDGFTDFYDEYLETQLEVAKGSTDRPALLQPNLPGMGLTSSHRSERL